MLRIGCMPPHRIGAFVREASRVVEAEHGVFERWGLHVGDVVEWRE